MAQQDFNERALAMAIDPRRLKDADIGDINAFNLIIQHQRAAGLISDETFRDAYGRLIEHIRNEHIANDQELYRAARENGTWENLELAVGYDRPNESPDAAAARREAAFQHCLACHATKTFEAMPNHPLAAHFYGQVVGRADPETAIRSAKRVGVHTEVEGDLDGRLEPIPVERTVDYAQDLYLQRQDRANGFSDADDEVLYGDKAEDHVGDWSEKQMADYISASDRQSERADKQRIADGNARFDVIHGTGDET